MHWFMLLCWDFIAEEDHAEPEDVQAVGRLVFKPLLVVLGLSMWLSNSNEFGVSIH
jgi:hypothetical protein